MLNHVQTHPFESRLVNDPRGAEKEFEPQAILRYIRAAGPFPFTDSQFRHSQNRNIPLVMPHPQLLPKTLPPEIWLEIFEWATYNNNLTLGNPRPFEPIPGTARDPSLQTRLALFSVCKTWREWMAQILYKDISIRRDIRSLQQALGRCEQSGPHYGDMVGTCSALVRMP